MTSLQQFYLADKPMTRRIITRKVQKTKPIRAAALSLLLTGLGELDSGAPARGISLFLIRILLLLTGPLYMRTHTDTDGMSAFLFVMVPVVCISILSPLQSALISVKKKIYHPGWYNRLVFYIVFFIAGSAATASALIVFWGTLSPVRISDMHSPVFTRGDIYLLMHRPAAYHPGELVLFSDNSSVHASRVLATGGDTASYFSRKPGVNESALPLEIFSREELRILGLPESSDVLAERNGRTRYPVAMPDNASTETDDPVSTAVSLKMDEIALLNDIRNPETRLLVIPLSHISGRIDGVLLSPSRGRMILPVSLGQKNE